MGEFLFNFPPEFSPAINNPVAIDGYVSRPVCIDDAGVVFALYAFPASLNDRKILQIMAADQPTSLVKIKRGIAFHKDTTGQKASGRKIDSSSAGLGAGVNGLINGLGAIGFAVPNRAESSDVEAGISFRLSLRRLCRLDRLCGLGVRWRSAK
jgi:hypothetical protein